MAARAESTRATARIEAVRNHLSRRTGVHISRIEVRQGHWWAEAPGLGWFKTSQLYRRDWGALPGAKENPA
ncbi:hypothetical protein [Thioalbus denitrificans]|uniref:Uncharacterized protein n=1 Tax=Thioalbus denitrificans TaxID=547122 RepID=A0A369CEV4_9GAMM|nr:hypothetical protein [Thioalbus denitrificans]RCX32101.1 hypothetical protein DFQ59_102454 [Thioalbus denitrificans]